MKVRSLQGNKFIAVIKSTVLKHLVILEESQKYLLKCSRRKKGIKVFDPVWQLKEPWVLNRGHHWLQSRIAMLAKLSPRDISPNCIKCLLKRRVSNYCSSFSRKYSATFVVIQDKVNIKLFQKTDKNQFQYTCISSCHPLMKEEKNCVFWEQTLSSPKSKMGKWRVLPFARLHPWFAGNRPVVVPFY